MFQRLFPLRSNIHRGSRKIKIEPVGFLDIDRTSESITIQMDGNNLGMTFDHRTAIEIAIAILERVPHDACKDHVIDNVSAKDRISKLISSM